MDFRTTDQHVVTIDEGIHLDDDGPVACRVRRIPRDSQPARRGPDHAGRAVHDRILGRFPLPVKHDPHGFRTVARNPQLSKDFGLREFFHGVLRFGCSPANHRHRLGRGLEHARSQPAFGLHVGELDRSAPGGSGGRPEPNACAKVPVSSRGGPQGRTWMTH